MTEEYEKDLLRKIKELQEELKSAKNQIEILRKLNKELEELSVIDELTGLYNQRHFHKRLEQEVEEHKNQRRSLCLLFFDVDGLKTYNDTYGHLGGDNVLKAVAQSVVQNIRENTDSGYRYGGDEFAVIFSNTNTEGAIEVAKRIKQGLRKAGFPEITLSFGIAELSPEMDDKALFRHADDAMYMAKRGRGARPDAPTGKIYVYD